MNPQSDAVPESPLDSQRIALPSMPPNRLLYWSIRLERWENRPIYLAPVAVGAVVLFGCSISTIAGIWESALRLDAHRGEAIVMPYDMAAGLLMLTSILVSVFYCLDALHGERRDRSILFWKSLPVSDRTTVLAKASIPLVVLPVFIFPVIVSTQLIMLMLNTAVLTGNGPGLTMLWTHLKFFQSSLALLYCLIVIALWHAPIYGWLLLVSAWARRATFLWAVLPPLALIVFERIAFRTSF